MSNGESGGSPRELRDITIEGDVSDSTLIVHSNVGSVDELDPGEAVVADEGGSTERVGNSREESSESSGASDEEGTERREQQDDRLSDLMEEFMDYYRSEIEGSIEDDDLLQNFEQILDELRSRIEDYESGAEFDPREELIEALGEMEELIRDTQDDLDEAQDILNTLEAIREEVADIQASPETEDEEQETEEKQQEEETPEEAEQEETETEEEEQEEETPEEAEQEETETEEEEAADDEDEEQEEGEETPEEEEPPQQQQDELNFWRYMGPAQMEGILDPNNEGSSLMELIHEQARREEVVNGAPEHPQAHAARKRFLNEVLQSWGEEEGWDPELSFLSGGEDMSVLVNDMESEIEAEAADVDHENVELPPEDEMSGATNTLLEQGDQTVRIIVENLAENISNIPEWKINQVGDPDVRMFWNYMRKGDQNLTSQEAKSKADEFLSQLKVQYLNQANESEDITLRDAAREFKGIVSRIESNTENAITISETLADMHHFDGNMSIPEVQQEYEELREEISQLKADIRHREEGVIKSVGYKISDFFRGGSSDYETVDDMKERLEELQEDFEKMQLIKAELEDMTAQEALEYHLSELEEVEDRSIELKTDPDEADSWLGTGSRMLKNKLHGLHEWYQDKGFWGKIATRGGVVAAAGASGWLTGGAGWAAGAAALTGGPAVYSGLRESRRKKEIQDIRENLQESGLDDMSYEEVRSIYEDIRSYSVFYNQQTNSEEFDLYDLLEGADDTPGVRELYKQKERERSEQMERADAIENQLDSLLETDDQVQEEYENREMWDKAHKVTGATFSGLIYSGVTGTAAKEIIGKAAELGGDAVELVEYYTPIDELLEDIYDVSGMDVAVEEIGDFAEWLFYEYNEDMPYYPDDASSASGGGQPSTPPQPSQTPSKPTNLPQVPKTKLSLRGPGNVFDLLDAQGQAQTQVNQQDVSDAIEAARDQVHSAADASQGEIDLNTTFSEAEGIEMQFDRGGALLNQQDNLFAQLKEQGLADEVANKIKEEYGMTGSDSEVFKDWFINHGLEDVGANMISTEEGLNFVYDGKMPHPDSSLSLEVGDDGELHLTSENMTNIEDPLWHDPETGELVEAPDEVVDRVESGQTVDIELSDATEPEPTDATGETGGSQESVTASSDESIDLESESAAGQPRSPVEGTPNEPFMNTQNAEIHFNQGPNGEMLVEHVGSQSPGEVIDTQDALQEALNDLQNSGYGDSTEADAIRAELGDISSSADTAGESAVEQVDAGSTGTEEAAADTASDADNVEPESEQTANQTQRAEASEVLEDKGYNKVEDNILIDFGENDSIVRIEDVSGTFESAVNQEEIADRVGPGLEENATAKELAMADKFFEQTQNELDPEKLQALKDTMQQRADKLLEQGHSLNTELLEQLGMEDRIENAEPLSGQSTTQETITPEKVMNASSEQVLQYAQRIEAADQYIISLDILEYAKNNNPNLYQNYINSLRDFLVDSKGEAQVDLEFDKTKLENAINNLKANYPEAQDQAA